MGLALMCLINFVEIRFLVLGVWNVSFHTFIGKKYRWGSNIFIFLLDNKDTISKCIRSWHLTHINCQITIFYFQVYCKQLRCISMIFINILILLPLEDVLSCLYICIIFLPISEFSNCLAFTSRSHHRSNWSKAEPWEKSRRLC